MFGQVVIGPPGSGKSTYCHGMHQFLSAIGRKVCVVNLDPANDKLPYRCALDIRDLISLEEVMEQLELGPNGGLMYSIETLDDEDYSEFERRIRRLVSEQNYIIFDCPGQVELYTHHGSLRRIFDTLTRSKILRLCVISLVDSIYLTSASLYVSILLLSLRSMLLMNLPQVNVISKIDLLALYGELPFRLDFYTEVQDLKYIIPEVRKEFNTNLGGRFVRLTEILGDIVEDFNLVAFEVLDVEDKDSMINLLSVLDKAVGYSFGSSEIGADSIWSNAVRQGNTPGMDQIDIHERWIENKDLYDNAKENKMDNYKSFT